MALPKLRIYPNGAAGTDAMPDLRTAAGIFSANDREWIITEQRLFCVGVEAASAAVRTKQQLIRAVDVLGRGDACCVQSFAFFAR